MHNLLLGVAKTQWFTRWIETGALRGNTPQTFRELNIVHEFLESFESPLWAGRLPLRVGEAAGGSLTADEYKFATTGPWAVVIPLVWERFRSEAEADYKAACERYPASLSEYKKKLKAWEMARKKGDKKTRRPREPKLPVPCMQEGEDNNSDEDIVQKAYDDVDRKISDELEAARADPPSAVEPLWLCCRRRPDH
ncbi:hypothetical protein B0H13DRAFT_2342357 [Mycena leptocephala]|nr:hypothetical protein B0H13DRAFT_2342357 [Mycena leptocephala]